MLDAHSKVLIVDDDGRTRNLLEIYLKEQGFAVIAIPNTRRVSQILATQPVKLLVLDLMLPGEDGLSLCRRLRGGGHQIPIIMLTAKGNEVDRIVGLEIGADDYLTKPFSPRELVARMHAVLRRQNSALPPGAPGPENAFITFGDLELDLTARVLKRGQARVHLTTGEFAVLRALVSHPKQPLSRDKLMDLARGRFHGAWDRSIDVQISRLRRIIEEDAGKPRYIQTVWGFGYVFVPDSTRA
jgi:DNA-binding response OmpR family regulator